MNTPQSFGPALSKFVITFRIIEIGRMIVDTHPLYVADACEGKVGKFRIRCGVTLTISVRGVTKSRAFLLARFNWTIYFSYSLIYNGRLLI
jgi:hypothetical protein